MARQLTPEEAAGFVWHETPVERYRRALERIAAQEFPVTERPEQDAESVAEFAALVLSGEQF